MKIFSFELKKMLYFRYGLIAILCFFTVFSISLILLDSTANPKAEYFSTEYNHYLEMMHGSANDEKVNFLENESLLIAETKIALDKLYDAYYDGDITDSEFNEELPKLQSVLANENGFEIIYKQLLYVNENTETRYFVDTNGWHALLSSHYADYILIILIAILIIPILCHEYDTKMNYINITTKLGGNIISKITVALLTVIAISILSSLVIYFFCAIKYGFSSGTYPLESVELFAGTTKELTLNGAFILMMIIRLIGFLLLGSLVLCVCTLLKKTSVSVLVILLITFLPEVLLSQNIKNMLPLPTTLIFNNTLFVGEKTEIDFFTKEVVTVFNEVSSLQVTLLVVGAVLLSLVFITISQWCNKNKFDVGRYMLPKKSKLAVLTLTVLTLITGCSSTRTQNIASYNTVDNLAVQNEVYEFIVDEENDFMPTFTNKQTGETNNLMRSPLVVNIDFEATLYADENYVYYAYYTQDKSDIRLEEVEKVTFMRVCLETFEETIYFEKSLVNTSKWDILNGFSNFFVSGNELYIMSSEVYKVNTNTGSVEVLDIDTDNNIAFDGRYIFYIGEKSVLYSYDTMRKESASYYDIVASSFYLIDNSILYVNRKDDNTLYIYDKEENTHTRIYDKSVSFFTVEDDTVTINTKTEVDEISIG